jgi:hypothetical protein
MKKYNIRTLLFLPVAGIWILVSVSHVLAQGQGGELKWIRIGELHDSISEQGTEVEGAGIVQTGTNLYWPAAYGEIQTCSRAKAIWLGATNYYDAKSDKTYDYKVVGLGPRPDSERIYQIFQDDFRMIGRQDKPIVVVDDIPASVIDDYDILDETDETLPCDRMVVVKFNTSIGVTVTKKIMAWSQQNHDNYFVYDFVLKNTGIIDASGTLNEQDLEGLILFLNYRYALVGEGKTSFNEGWATWESSWGRNTVNQVIGTDPSASDFRYRAMYSWYGPDAGQAVSDDWGCPNFGDDGLLAAAKYAGTVVLHADKSVSDRSDDRRQPTTTMYLGSDAAVTQLPYSQYDEGFMTDRYATMSAGHADVTHADEVGNGYASTWGTDAGGYSQTQGFGPYSLAFGDSLHFVIAEGVAGLGRTKNRQIGQKWVNGFNGIPTGTLVRPDGSETTDYDLYKREWVQTCEDSILQTFDYAVLNYQNGYDIPKPPPPPDRFEVKSGGDRIILTWSENALSWPNFDGYEIWRAQGNIMDMDTRYDKIWECDASNVVHTYEDRNASRGFDYYYFIQTKDNGSTNELHPGVPLRSSMFWTLTKEPAYLRRPMGLMIDQVRVVPNPYDIRARVWQFGDEYQYDRLAFYEIPGICKLKIFTERGDLIWEKDHTDGSGDELWDSMTSSGQIVVSGIYILYVEVTEDIIAEEEQIARRDYYDPVSGDLVYHEGDMLFSAGEKMYSTGESVMRKFVIIR